MPGLKQQLRDDLTTAMRARDDVTVSTLRLTLAAITKAEVAGDTQVELDDDAIVALIASEARKRAEAAGLYEKGGRNELAEQERAEAVVLDRYLPAALDDAALEAIVAEEVRAAANAGNAGPKAMGSVVKAVRARAGANADGARIAAMVKAALG